MSSSVTEFAFCLWLHRWRKDKAQTKNWKCSRTKWIQMSCTCHSWKQKDSNCGEFSILASFSLMMLLNLYKTFRISLYFLRHNHHYQSSLLQGAHKTEAKTHFQSNVESVFQISVEDSVDGVNYLGCYLSLTLILACHVYIHGKEEKTFSKEILFSWMISQWLQIWFCIPWNNCIE